MEEHPEKMDEYMEQFVDLQLMIHQQRVPAIKTLRHKLADQINSLKDIDATARYELSARLQSMPNITNCAMVTLIQAISSLTKKENCG